MSPKATIEALQTEYRVQEPLARIFLGEFLHQLSALVAKARVKLALPIEGRVKEWSSVCDKLERKTLQLEKCCDLPDFVGVRAITLFARDVETLCRLVDETFVVKTKEDKAASLESARFGYRSRHFVVGLSDEWKRIPGFSGLDFAVEIQVRTLSQHLWASASHVLQYKKEADVPADVARSIHRVAALLETVDLEFERVLNERESYMQSPEAIEPSARLDSDNIEIVLDSLLPPENSDESDNYSELLTDLSAFGVATVEELRRLVEKYRRAALVADQKEVRARRVEGYPNSDNEAERAKKGVFFTHVGLTRQILDAEFGKRWRDYSEAHLTEGPDS